MLHFLNVCSLICAVCGSKILGVSLTPSYSHQVVFQPLWKELSLRGHQVTTITAYPLKDPKLVNLTEIDLSVAQLSNQNIKKLVGVSQTNFIYEIYHMYTLMANVLDQQLEHPPVKQLIEDERAKFDLVIVEYLWSTPLAFATRFNCPYIGIISLDGTNTIYRKIGNPTHSSLYPDNLLPFGDKLSLFQRVISFIYEFGYDVYLEGVLQEMEQKVVHKHFGGHYPSIAEMARNMSMLFVDADPIFHHNRPLVPGVVQIGSGSHIAAAKPLPKELSMLDNATNGFIYFSLGSNIKSEFLSLPTIKMILEVFAELPYTVLWKFGEDIPNKPGNVIVSKWFPQRDVLGHPNIKLFITQGGMQSMDEAIYFRVPMVGIPIFFDQPHNIKKMVNRGFGLELDRNNLEKNSFKTTILEVINNPRYRNTLTELADLAQDQPMTGLERAVWWSEYVIRHKGAKHLRSPLLDLPWYQYLFLDVIAVLLLGLLAVLWFLVFTFRLLIKLIKWKIPTVSNEKKSS
ncbi:hypothetical protein RI129_012497 [Pyrocoelia pectoralis]|uniref:UDP-glucuronosyltransferase n=1 Tax=Pyrocoelia pectoralis TaxID=417401 RepID=A0AAN7UY57_9COLE